MQSKKDNIFSENYESKFEFNEAVASVFDDMLERSIPFYDEILNIAIFFILRHLQNLDSIESPIIYDLGCSTGNLLLRLSEALAQDSKLKNKKTSLIGIDNSNAMIERATLKSSALNANVKFFTQDFLKANLQKSDVICAFYTMQFVRPLQRAKMIEKIYETLKNGGIFLFAEKVISKDCVLEAQMIECYYEYKKTQGYTQGEIYKKREALENVLVPYSVDENIAMLESSGFSHIEILFKWINFTLFLARK